ncbi:MAG: metallophosphoesterase [Christensenellaceae bacterium]|nr:metallophosphoesterase [Christensenellaceae bacterium]
MKRLFLYILILNLLLCSCSAKAPLPEAFTAPTPAPQTEKPAAAPEPTPVSTPEPTPEPDKLDAAEGIYTIGWISDTQHYSAKYPDHFYKMTEFLNSNKDRMNLGYIVHTGDLVHNYDIDEQWQIADKAMQTIDDIPHGVLAGNHDFNNDEGTYGEYAEYFGEDRYADKAWYGGSYKDNRCHYDLITLGKTDYLFV